MSNGLPSVDHPMSPDGPRRPAILVFDVNETLSDMSPMAQRFEDVGAPSHMAKTWFAGLLRDGFALTAVDASASFARIAAEALRVSLHALPLNRGTEEAVQHIMDGFGGLQVHPDVPDGIRAMNELGIRLVTLNGSASVAEGLFERAGIRDDFDRLPDVIHRDRVSVQLVTGQRQLRKHDHPGLRSTDGLSVHPSVVRNIVRGAGRLHRGDFQWSGHSSEPGAFARS